MKLLKLLVSVFAVYVLVGMAYFAPGCTTTGDPDWNTMEMELVLAEGTLDRARITYPSKAELIDDLEAARAEALKAVQLIQVGEPGTALAYLEAALALVQPYLEDEDLKLAAFLLQETIIRIQVNAVP